MVDDDDDLDCCGFESPICNAHSTDSAARVARQTGRHNRVYGPGEALRRFLSPDIYSAFRIISQMPCAPISLLSYMLR